MCAAPMPHREVVMAYRKVDAGIFGDDKFLKLSRPREPAAQFLWLYLLCGRRTTNLPGLVMAGKMTLAEDLYWDNDLNAFLGVFQELMDLDLIQYDHEARLIYLPKAIEHNPPGSVNTIKGWKAAFDRFPACELRTRWLLEAAALLESKSDAKSRGMAEAFALAFKDDLDLANGLGKSFAKAFAKEQGKALAEGDAKAFAKAFAKGYSGNSKQLTDNGDDEILDLSSPENQSLQEIIALGVDQDVVLDAVENYDAEKCRRAAAWTLRRPESDRSNPTGYFLALLRNHHLDPPPPARDPAPGPTPEELALRVRAAAILARSLAPEREAIESYTAKTRDRADDQALDDWFLARDAATQGAVVREAMALAREAGLPVYVDPTTGRGHTWLLQAIEARLSQKPQDAPAVEPGQSIVLEPERAAGGTSGGKDNEIGWGCGCGFHVVAGETCPKCRASKKAKGPQKEDTDGVQGNIPCTPEAINPLG